MNRTYLKYTFVGYLRKGLNPRNRSKLKEIYEEMLNSSTSVKEWTYYPRKGRYEVIINQELPCFNFDTFIIDAVAELLQQLIESDLFASNLVLVDGIFLDHLDGEYKLSLDELRNFVHMVDSFYAKPQFLIMDSAREEILTKYKSWSICKELYNTLLLNPDLLLPFIKEFVKSARVWGWLNFIKYFRKNGDFRLNLTLIEGKYVYTDSKSTNNILTTKN